MKQIRAIMVDDEESARQILHSLLEKFCPQIELVGTFTHVETAVAGIKTLQPDLVFLDIEMPNYAGYEIIHFFENINFEIVFISAYDKYAIKAFEVSAVDYLLKPIDIERLQEAVQRVSHKLEPTFLNQRLSHLKASLQSHEIKSIIVSKANYQHVVPLVQIIAIEAQESYSLIHTTEGKFVASKNLKHFEKLLSDHNNFLRVHKSWLINLDHMIKYSKSQLEISLHQGITSRLSKYKMAEFEQIITS